MEFGSAVAFYESAKEGVEEEVLVDELKGAAESVDHGLVRPDDRRTCEVVLMDTGLETEYSRRKDENMHSCQGFVVCLSRDVPASLARAEEILAEIGRLDNATKSILVLETKHDSTFSKDAREFSNQARKIAGRFGAVFSQCSAKEGSGVSESVELLIHHTHSKSSTGFLGASGRTKFMQRYLFVILGMLGTGKSAFAQRFVRDLFVGDVNPQAEDTFNKSFILRKPIALADEKPEKLDDGKKKSASALTGLLSMFKTKDSAQGKQKAPPPQKEAFVSPHLRSMQSGTKLRAEKTTTNVICLRVGEIKNLLDNCLTDAPLKCSKCSGIINKFCTLTTKTLDDPENLLEGSTGEWDCCFCGTKNRCMPSTRLPEKESIEFLLKAAPTAGKTVADGGVVVFLVDCSGSMCVSSTIPPGFGMISIGNEEYLEQKKMVEELNRSLPRDEQLEIPRFDPSHQRFVSRIQCLQSALDIQIDDIAKHSPNRQIAIISFSDVVRVHCGDTATVIDPELYNNFDELYSRGKQFPLSPIGKNTESLKKVIKRLREGGQTALYPALVVGLGVASANRDDGELIVATDGISNIGIGKVEESRLSHEEKIAFMESKLVVGWNSRDIRTQLRTVALSGNRHCDSFIICDEEGGLRERRATEREQFFNKAGDVACEQNTRVSIIGISDDQDCDFEMLEILSGKSSGEMNIASPLELIQKMREILDQEKIAKNVNVTVHCGQEFIFRPNDEEQKAEGCSVSFKMNCVHENSDAIVQYDANPAFSGTARVQVPFQFCCEYVKLDGSKMLRVSTRMVELTKKREDAEMKSNMSIVSKNAIKQTAAQAKVGDTLGARLKLNALKKMQSRALSRAVLDEDDEKLMHKQMLEVSNSATYEKMVSEKLDSVEMTNEEDILEELKAPESADLSFASRESSSKAGKKKKSKLKDYDRATLNQMASLPLREWASGEHKENKK